MPAGVPGLAVWRRTPPRWRSTSEVLRGAGSCGGSAAGITAVGPAGGSAPTASAAVGHRVEGRQPGAPVRAARTRRRPRGRPARRDRRRRAAPAAERRLARAALAEQLEPDERRARDERPTPATSHCPGQRDPRQQRHLAELVRAATLTTSRSGGAPPTRPRRTARPPCRSAARAAQRRRPRARGAGAAATRQRARASRRRVPSGRSARRTEPRSSAAGRRAGRGARQHRLDVRQLLEVGGGRSGPPATR